jgi:hypothetical protein
MPEVDCGAYSAGGGAKPKFKQLKTGDQYFEDIQQFCSSEE